VGQIAILPDPVADQIAAGEVIERPASVVKELVENALDAGATEVTVELEGGGRSFIAVSDNGVGMDPDDARLAIDRHATSKIRRVADLVGVPTYGFRGEALAAIASVSKFVIETAPAEHNGGSGEATRVVVEGGKLGGVEITARQRGTTVRVERLFYNTPARRKFLRSQATETRAVVQAVTVLALARLDIAFKVLSDKRTLIDVARVSDTVERIESLFGRRIAEGLVPVDYNAGPLSVRGFVQRPADAKPTGRKAFLFVNGRPFRDPFLVRAAEAGYRATIDPGCRPTMFLSLALPGDAVDVNVHPTKLEVRFRDRRFVEGSVEEGVRAALGGFRSAAVAWAGVRSTFPDGGGPSHAPTGPSAGERAATVGWAGSIFDTVEGKSGDTAVQQAPAEQLGELLQVFRTYIVVETPEGVAFVDQHSAHERILYEEVMAQLKSEGAAAQRLLLPLTIDLDAKELETVEASIDLLKAIGYEIEGFGGRSIVVHAVPNPHPRFDAKRCFEEMAADMARGRFGGWANRLERFAATYACRAAIKAGHILEAGERRHLLNRLFACELPPHDVHGRPTIVQLPRDELEKRFGRS
jgi:DNA mismatch repair protein MutL